MREGRAKLFAVGVIIAPTAYNENISFIYSNSCQLVSEVLHYFAIFGSNTILN